jgi:benzoyl-CoA reductase subunit C
MENRLRQLIEANNEVNRKKWALEWKKEGKKVIGFMSSYVPEEVIWAADMLPWRITGTWQANNIPHARAYRTDSSCAYCTHVMESVLSGELSFLDGIITADTDQDLLRTVEVLEYLNKAPFFHCLHVPFFESERTLQFFSDEIKRMMTALEGISGVKIKEESLWDSIHAFNRTRILLGKVYELRKRDNPPLSGAEVLGITTAAGVMPKDQFNHELETLLPYLEERKTGLHQIRPRILIASEKLDHPGYLDIVEESCLVAMDDMDTGSRYFNKNVDTEVEDPADALAKRYLSRHGSPRMADWDVQFDQVMEWIKDYKIDGVISLPLSWCYPQIMHLPFFSRRLEEEGIPHVSVNREYQLANEGQLRTRIGAFVEMLA